MFVKRDKAASIKEVVERNTGIKAEELLQDVRDPFLDHLDEAVQFVKDYIHSHPRCRVTVVGDYDSDGVNATSIMYWCFMKMKISPVLRVPHRMSEGYGLSEKIIDEIPSGLVITVDNGISALAAVKKAKEKGLAVVVTDHHLPVRDDKGNMILPEADVLLDPHVDGDKSEFKDYCGAAIAYRFARAMFGAKFPELLVLASIATVTDVMPLIGANRTLVKDGLNYINKRRVVPGLDELLKKTNLEDHINEGDYGFMIGPTFNAPGRLYDNGAESVVKLLCTKRGDFTAKYKADERPIVLYEPTIPEGIVGIVAGQLAEQYYCPTVVFTDCGKEGVIKGSGRTIQEIHLKNALDKISDKMLGYGGHAGAAGLSIKVENLTVFREAFAKACGVIPDPPEDLLYDLELSGNLESICDELELYSPYGEQNAQIRFHTVFDLEPGGFRIIGDGTHFMTTVKDRDLTVMGFDLTAKYKALGYPEHIECVGYLNRSWFKGKSSLKFEILDFEAA